MSKATPRPRKRTAPKRATTPRLPADLKAAISAAHDKKAENVVVLDLRKASSFTDFFVICTATNVRQAHAIADGIEDALRKTGTRPSLVEGSSKSEWVLLDYFDFIIHIFTPAVREFYALERLWGDAVTITIPDPTA